MCKVCIVFSSELSVKRIVVPFNTSLAEWLPLVT